MAFRIDARLPVHLAPAGDACVPAPDGALVLAEQGADLPSAAAATRRIPFAPPHDATGPAAPPSCACCAGRAPFATALAALFHERARGSVPFFRTVLAVGTPRGLAHARAALESDPFLLARYRVADGEG